MKLDINGNKYYLKDRWREVTIREMAHAFDVLSKQPPSLLKVINTPSDSEKQPEIDEKVLTKFYIDWIECFSNIPRSVLEGEIVMDQPGTVSIKYIANACLHFLGEPKKTNQVNRFKFEGRQYRIIESFKTLSGVNKLLSGATFGDWVNLTALMSAFDGLNKGKYIALAQMSAVLFQPSAGDKRPETIEKRAEAFMDLDCETAYAGYFFLDRHISKLLRFLKTSSKKEIRDRLGVEGLITKYRQTFIGRLKLYLLQKLGFLTVKE